jgi:hypothetical protein
MGVMGTGGTIGTEDGVVGSGETIGTQGKHLLVVGQGNYKGARLDL